MQKKFKTSFTLTREAQTILSRLTAVMGINRSAVIEVLLRRARKEGSS